MLLALVGLGEIACTQAEYRPGHALGTALRMGVEIQAMPHIL